MATTKYHVHKGENDELVVVKSKRATAVEVARQVRKDEGVGVRVVTGAGNEVFALAAPRKINMSPKYTRVVGLPEGVEAPEGARVAYVRPKRGLALLDLIDSEAGDDDENRYGVLVLATSTLEDERYATTRDGGARLREGVKS